MNARYITRAAMALLAALATAMGAPAAHATDANTGSLRRPDVVLQPIRAEWPVLREASGRWIVAGEAVVRSAGPQSVKIEMVRLQVFDQDGRLLATQVSKGGRAFKEMLEVFTFDARGKGSRKPGGTSTVAPGDVAVALVGTLAGDGPRVPHRAEITLLLKDGQASVTVPLSAFDPGQRMSWPLELTAEKAWMPANNFSPEGAFPHHRKAVLWRAAEAFIGQRFAIDIVQTDVDGKTATPHGSRQKENYHAWGEEILSAGSGKVVAVVKDQPDQAIGQQDPVHPGGNYVVIQHGPRLFSLYAHMMQGSAAVSVGDPVASGQTLGRVGNSGNTTEPHLHFHLVDRWDGLDPVNDIFASQGLPALFWNAHVRRGKQTFALQGTTPLAMDRIQP